MQVLNTRYNNYLRKRAKKDWSAITVYGSAFICACTYVEFTCVGALMLHHSECMHACI